MDEAFNNLFSALAARRSNETKWVRIERTGLKQWQKSRLMAAQVARRGEPADKWETLKKNYEGTEQRDSQRNH